jgi:molybdenum cofactor cytidylyltransferase
VVEAIVLAAGLSRRMGGPNPYEDTTVIGAVVRALVAAEMPVTLVTGRDAELVSAAAPGAKAFYNERYMEGIGSSIAAGAALIQQAAGIMVVLGDMPGLQASVVRRLVTEFERAPTGAIVGPVYSDEPDRLGHPIIFSIHHRPALRTLSGDIGARGIIEENRASLIEVPVEGRLDDVDSALR